MRIAVISTQNRLLSGAIIKYMQERSELRPVRILEDNDEEPLKTCKSVQAESDTAFYLFAAQKCGSPDPKMSAIVQDRIYL